MSVTHTPHAPSRVTAMTEDVDCEPGDTTRLPSGRRLGPYELVRYVGSGAMGVVYEARDCDFDERVAIKTLAHVDPWRLYRLKHEFRTLAGITHKNLVRHDELACVGDHWYFAMEFVEGVDVVTALARDPSQLHHVMGQLAAGLHHLHQAGVLHLDLKPSNVLVTPTGRVVILDFGLARSLDSSTTKSSETSGTPGYIAPERQRGEHVGPAADWYAFGVILFQAAVGRLALGQQRPSAFGAELPPALDDLCWGLLASAPGQRPTPESILELFGIVASANSSDDGKFIGREQELATLRHRLGQCQPGEPGVMWIHGPGGIGKSRLLAEFARELEGRGEDLLLRGRCFECEGVPYGGFDAAIDQLAGGLPDITTDDRRLLAVAQLFPVLTKRIHSSLQVQIPPGRREAFAGVVQLLLQAAGQRRVVLCLDNLDLAGEDSVALLLDLLLPRGGDGRILVVATIRERTWLEDLRRRAGLRGQYLVESEIGVGPLDPDTCGQFFGGRTRAQRDVLVQAAQGNPLIANVLSQSTDDAVDFATLIGRRLNSLSSRAQTLLSVLAVAGQPIGLRTLVRACGVAVLRGELARLRAMSLVRMGGSWPSATLEIHHREVAASVCQGMEPAVRARLHRTLATALEREPKLQHELLMRHWCAAGDLQKARTHGLLAADEARQAKAFGRLATLLGEVANWTDDRVQRAQMFERRGQACSLAGRNSDAARAYLQAVKLGRREPATVLAARALMAAGQVDEGLDLLQPKLAREGLKLPKSSVAAGFALLWDYARLRRRGLQISQAPNLALQRRFDLCWSVGMGLVQVRPVEGMLFLVRGLALALDSGDRTRSGRGLAAYGAFHRLLGAVRISELARGQALEIAKTNNDPTLMGFVDIVSAADALLIGAWQRVVEHATRGVNELRRAGIGMTWERVVGTCFELAARDQLGDYIGVEQRAGQALRDAEASGDLFARIVFSQFLAQAVLIAGDPTRAQSLAGNGLEQWTSRQYTLQHFYQLRVDARCDLYRGDPQAAHDRVRSHWSDIRRAGLLRNSISRIDAYLLYARTALACRDLRAARHALQRISPKLRRDAPLHRAWLQVRVDELSGQRVDERYCQVAAGFRGEGMLAYAEALEYRGAHKSTRTVVARQLRARGVAEPDRWIWSFVP